MASLSTQNLLAFSRMAPALYARQARRLPPLASLILVIVIARLLAELVWLLVPTPAAAIWRPAPPPPRVASAQVDLNLIAGAAIFGQFQAVAKPVAADLAAAPDTQLSLTLLGILNNGRDAESSRALIGTQGGEEKPYSIGDDVTRGVTLQAIFADRVILSRSGKLETLRLDKTQSGGSGLLPARPVDEDEDNSGDEESGSNAEPSLAQIRSKLLADPSKVSDFIRVQPVNSGKGVNGYRIYPGMDRSVFTSSGLRPGDVVTSVNGVQLNDPSKALQLLNDLSQSSQLNLTVDRGGVSQSFNINFSQ